MEKKEIIIIAFVVTLFFVGQYFILVKWGEEKEQERIKNYEEGYNKGLSDAVSVLFYNLEDCNTTTIWFENLTKQVLDTSCLKIESKISSP